MAANFLPFKFIPLTKGCFAIVDSKDFDWLNQWKWCVNIGKSNSYAYRTKRFKGNKYAIYMHRQIMQPSEGQDIDHINHNGLNNRRSNLRLCTRSQNQYNRKAHGKTSKYKGVAWHIPGNKWVSHITAKGKQYYLGLFNTELEAAEAYKKAARIYHKNFAYF